MGRFENQVAVVTGGNSGIGLAAAQAFAREGARVAILGRDPATLEEAVRSMEGRAIGVQGDVTAMADLEELFRRSAELGPVNALFVNAGIGAFVPLAEITEEHFDRLFAINVKGALFTIQKALPHLSENAAIVLNASVANQLGMENASVYSATKAAVRSLARTLSTELLPRGIRVNVVSPGPIETPIFDKMGLPQEAVEEFGAQIVQQVPQKRFGQPAEVADAVLFLASPQSSYVVGAEITVDGGMTQL